jgi:hypothetical protein
MVATRLDNVRKREAAMQTKTFKAPEVITFERVYPGTIDQPRARPGHRGQCRREWQPGDRGRHELSRDPWFRLDWHQDQA